MNNFAIIIPAFNEKDNLEKLIQKIFKVLPNTNIYIIDDTKIKSNIPNIKKNKRVNYYLRKNKKGRGSAVIFGIKLALKNKNNKNFIEMDADLSHAPNELIRNIIYFKKHNYDLLISSRYMPKSKIVNWPIRRRILSILSNFLINIVLNLGITDYTNGFRIYSKRSARCIIKNCGKISDGFIILSEILFILDKQGYKIGEISSFFKNRNRGTSSVNLNLVFSSLLGLFRLFFIRLKNL